MDESARYDECFLWYPVNYHLKMQMCLIKKVALETSLWGGNLINFNSREQEKKDNIGKCLALLLLSSQTKIFGMMNTNFQWLLKENKSNFHPVSPLYWGQMDSVNIEFAEILLMILIILIIDIITTNFSSKNTFTSRLYLQALVKPIKCHSNCELNWGLTDYPICRFIGQHSFFSLLVHPFSSSMFATVLKPQAHCLGLVSSNQA